MKLPGQPAVESAPVRLGSCIGGRQDPGFNRFRNLQQTLYRLRAAKLPGAAMDEELVHVGDWLNRTGLGRIAEYLAAAAKDWGGLTVEMRLPARLADFEALPWELARVNGEPLTWYGVTMVRGLHLGRTGPAGSATTTARQTPHVPDMPYVPPALPTKFLALFSLPNTEKPLDLGFHRTELREHLLALARGKGFALDERMRQFGVGRSALSALAGKGWDVIHIVSHGLPGRLWLEHPDGSLDEVGTEELIRRLRAARRRVKLVCLTACWSGAGDRGDDRPDAEQEPEPVLSSLAARIAGELGCAVVAMRFPVEAGFAVCFDKVLYRELLSSGHTLPNAVRIALDEAVTATAPSGSRRRMLAACAPMLYGPRAAELRIEVAPARDEIPEHGALVTGPLPDYPPRFVGRVGEMAAANACLAPESGARGVVIHGPKGAGSTTCAAVLAQDHRDAFDVIAWCAPGTTPEAYLEKLVRSFPGSERPDARDPGYWQRLVEAVERCLAGPERVMLALDRVDQALSADPRWRPLIDTLIAAGARITLLLTARSVPDLPGGDLRRIALPSFSGAEAGLLTGNLPELAALWGTTYFGWVLDEAADYPGTIHAAARAAAESPEVLEAWLRRRP